MTSESMITKLVNLAVTVCNNESLKDPQPISFEDLINFAEVVFEDNYIPSEITTVKIIMKILKTRVLIIHYY